MRFFFLKVAPAIMTLGVLFEGVSYGLALTNLPSDLAVLAGMLLVGLTVSACFSFILYWYLVPKELK